MADDIHIRWISYKVSEHVKIKFSIDKMVSSHHMILAKCLNDNLHRILTVSPTAIDNLHKICLETPAGKEVKF
jgi:hypothetical protein